MPKRDRTELIEKRLAELRGQAQAEGLNYTNLQRSLRESEKRLDQIGAVQAELQTLLGQPLDDRPEGGDNEQGEGNPDVPENV